MARQGGNVPKTAMIADLPWTEYQRRVEEDAPVVLLPIGSLEQHGPHSPLGSDEMLTRLISVAVAERVGGLVAPSIPYGCRSQPRTGGGWHFSGTTSIEGNTLALLVRDVLRELGRHGVRKIAVMDTHFENEWFVIEGIEHALREMRRDGLQDVKIVKFRYFEFITPEVLERVFPDGFPGWALEHAGVMTTSLHLHLTPELVDMNEAPTHGVIAYPPYDVFPFDPARGTRTGSLNSPRTASAESGKLIFDHVVTALTAAIDTEFGSDASPRSRHDG
jgi:creatinine amidohydrolase